MTRRPATGVGPGGWRRLPRSARIAAVVVLLLAVLAVIGAVFTPYDPTRNLVGAPAQPPSGAHWFGTDIYGRDVFSRVLAGAWVSLIAALVTPLLGMIAGILIGATTAVAPRPLKDVLEWLLELSVTFPAVVIAVALAALFQPGLTTTVVVLSLLFAPAIGRVVYAATGAELQRDYVTVERVMGAGRWWILARHVGRNVAGPVIVFVSALAAGAVLTEAALSFLGLGVQPPAPSWGNVVNDGRALVGSGGWWVSGFGGLAIFTTALALSMLSDGLAVALDTPAPTADGEARAAGGVGGAGGGGAGPPPPPPGGARGAAGVGPARAAAGAATRTPPRSLLHAVGGGVPATEVTPVPAGAPANPRALLEVRDLTVRFPSAHGGRPVVTGLSLDVEVGESVGLIGESGSGKSLTSLAVLGLLPPGAQVTGSIRVRGRELTTLPAAQRRQLLGTELAMVYQDPLAALNPGMRIKAQLAQVCRRSGRHTPGELLEVVRLSPRDTLPAYPHQLSGGQRQRVVLAMALAGDPVLLLADEPTTALDVTLQAEISDLLTELITARGLAMLLVSHDLPLVAELTTRINVMYAGEIVETGPTEQVLRAPRHRYTAMLATAVRGLEEQRPVREAAVAEALAPEAWPAGCRFHDRCAHSDDVCAGRRPPWRGDQQRGFACHHPRSAGAELTRDPEAGVRTPSADSSRTA